jgi:cytochrome c6
MYMKLFMLSVLGTASCFVPPPAMVVPMTLRGPHSACVVCMSLPNTATTSAVAMLLSVAMSTTAFAADIDAGEKIFNANCAACHAHGQNAVLKERTLEKEAIQTYLENGFNEAAVVYQVRNGKGAMPSFQNRLSMEEIDDVAKYVIDMAEKEAWE